MSVLFFHGGLGNHCGSHPNHHLFLVRKKLQEKINFSSYEIDVVPRQEENVFGTPNKVGELAEFSAPEIRRKLKEKNCPIFEATDAHQSKDFLANGRKWRLQDADHSNINIKEPISTPNRLKEEKKGCWSDHLEIETGFAKIDSEC